MRFVIAAAAAAFLIIGFALRPDLAPPQQESPGPLLQEVVQQREAESVLRALQDVGAATVQYGAFVVGEPAPLAAWSDWEPALAAPADPGRYGVVIGEGDIVAYARGLSAAAPVRVSIGDGRELMGRITGPVSAAGLARITVQASAPLVAPPRAITLPLPGESVVAAAPTPDGRLIAPLFVAAVSGDTAVTTVPLDPFLGAPVFSAARELVGVVALRGGAARIVFIDAALRADPTPVTPPAPLGVTLEAVSEGDASVVMVRALDPDGRAAAAGLRAGDIVEAIDEVVVTGLPQALESLAPGRAEGVDLRIRRARRVMPITVPPVEGQP
jgi:S1-C subfamily serine protease